MKKLSYIASIALLMLSNNLLAEEKTKLDDITVTAQKTEENLQKVPMTVSVLDEFTLEDSLIEDTKDISPYVPNLSTMHGGSRDYISRITLRGISNTGIGDPAVALYIDDIPYSDIYAFDSPLFDVERIEVLKGPQGTLYGKNTEAGVINIITKQPNNEFGGKLSLEAGNFNHKQVTGSMNFPIIKDELFMKLSALKGKKDGFIDNLYDGSKIDNQDTLSLRANTLYKLNDNLDMNLILGLTKYDDGGGWPIAPFDKQNYMNVTGISDLKDFQTAFNYKGVSSAKTKMGMLKVKYYQDKYDIVSITGYRDMNNKHTLDADFTPMKYFEGMTDRQTSTFNQELRVSSQLSDSFKWIVGAYYSNKDLKHKTGYILEEDGAASNGVPTGTEEMIAAKLKIEDMAIFGQSTLRFLDDSLGVTAGVRFEKSKRTMDDRIHTFGGVDTVPVITGLEKNYTKVLPKLTVDYFLNEDVMLYTTLSKGYKSGGFSYAVDKKDLTQYDPEVSKSVELGVKSSFPSIGLMFNFATFFTKVDGYQDRVQLDPITIVQENVTDVDIKGLEFETSYKINDNFTLFGNIGLIDAKYGDYIDPLTKENFKDKKVTFVPKYDMNLGLKYRNDSGFFANLEMQNIGKKYFDRSNAQNMSSYKIYNTKIGYEQEDWDMYLSVKNIGDKQYFQESFITSDAVGYMGTVGNPRTVKLVYNYRF